MDIPAIRWAVPGIIADGLNLLVGPPKIGKSWLGLNLAVAIASGTRVLGKVGVTAGPVCYFALEDPIRRLRSRLTLVLRDDPWPNELHFRTTCPHLPEGADEIKAWLEEHPEARLVIVDVFARVETRDHSRRKSQYDADYEAMTALKGIADDYGVAILVMHHTRKADADDWIDSVSGTHGLAGGADAVLVLSRSRSSAQGVLKITGRDVEEAEYALGFAPDLGSWTLLDGPASDYDVSDTRRAILAAVREHEGIGPKQIAEATGISYDVVRQLVRKMVDTGHLDTDGNGRYSIPFTPFPAFTGSEQSERSER
jgi:hypothetical protein